MKWWFWALLGAPFPATGGDVRPAIPGFSVGYAKAVPKDAGTFGCLVRKKNRTAALYILSNSHVLARSGLGSVGDGIVQPSRL